MVQVSANEYIALPSIDEESGNIDYITTLTMKQKGMFQLSGDAFIQPKIKINDKYISLKNNLLWFRDSYWIPTALYNCDDFDIKIIYLTPRGQKAIALRIEVLNKSNKAINVTSSFNLNWEKTFHVVNESYEIESEIIKKSSNWNHGVVYQQFIKVPLLSISQMDERSEVEVVEKGNKYVYDYFLGLGFEEVSSSTSAKHLKRIGFDSLFEDFKSYLESKIIKVDDKYLSNVLNTNLFFSYYFSAGKTFDTEELVLVTSRSPRYYVSAAYWDRDSLLWSFPSFLLIDKSFSKEVLKYVFKKQIKNIGEHSRFIDGTLLEPGFELDELCAPVLALENYIKATNDVDILKQNYISEGLNKILAKLKSKKHKIYSLYETFLMPTDDFTKEKYLTYDNVLVWKSLLILSKYLNNSDLEIEAKNVEKAIYDKLVQNNMFVWSSDLEGNSSIYDEPPGSLLLLNHLGFCKKDSKIWINTINHIKSKDYKLSFSQSNIKEIGCEHAPHPWILSFCNSLLSGFGETAIENLKKTKMDNYIACESVDEKSGVCTSGEAFATCAGFLAFSIYKFIFELRN